SGDWDVGVHWPAPFSRQSSVDSRQGTAFSRQSTVDSRQGTADFVALKDAPSGRDVNAWAEGFVVGELKIAPTAGSIGRIQSGDATPMIRARTASGHRAARSRRSRSGSELLTGFFTVP